MDKYWDEQDVLLAGQLALDQKKPDGQAPSKDELIAYLTKYQRDELSTGTMDRPENFAVQRDKLILAMRKKFPEHGYNQIISRIDADAPKFWELMLSLHFVSHDIELTNNIGYDDREIAPGIRRAWKLPYAEFTIVSESLKEAVAAQASTGVDEPTQKVSIVPGDKGAVYARLADGTNYWISSLRVDNAPYHFLHYLLKHPDTLLTSTIIRTDTKIDAKYGMTELVRQCGFTKELLPLKPIFFPETTKTKVRFRQTVKLNATQIALLASRNANRTKPQLIGKPTL